LGLEFVVGRFIIAVGELTGCVGLELPKLQSTDFRHGISIVERDINLAREKWSLQA